MRYITPLLSLLLVVLLCSSSQPVAAQSPLSLEQCLDQAWQQSRAALKAQLGIQRAALQVERQQANRLPLVQLDGQSGYQFGRNIDPTTNSFNSDGIFFNSATVNTSWVLYQGGRNQYAKAHRQGLLEAAQAQEEQIKFQLRLEVTNAYLNILLAEEFLAQLEERSVATQEQLQKINADIQLGVRPEKERVQLEAQLAAENRNRIDATAQLDQAYRGLKQLLRLAPDSRLDISPPSEADWQASLVQHTQTVNYAQARNNYPAIRGAEAQLKANQLAEQLLKTERKPTLTLFGQLNTRYSSAAQTLRGLSQIPIEQEVLLQGQPSTLTVMQTVAEYENSPFFQQWRNNFGQAVGVQLSYPIFDRFANKLSRQEANIATLEAQLSVQEQEDGFRYELDRLRQRLIAARATYQAAQESVDIAQVAHDMAKDAFLIGASSSYELLDAKTQLHTEQARLLQAKYDCLFSQKILFSFAAQ